MEKTIDFVSSTFIVMQDKSNTQEGVVILKHQMRDISATVCISWPEQVTFDEMMSALY